MAPGGSNHNVSVKAKAPEPSRPIAAPAACRAWVVRDLPDIERVVCLVEAPQQDIEWALFHHQFDPGIDKSRGVGLWITFHADPDGAFWPKVSIASHQEPPADLLVRLEKIEAEFLDRQKRFGHSGNPGA